MFGGWLMAPVFGLTSAARRARTFHPRGPLYYAHAVRHAATPPELHALADRLTGEALVRFSGALWKTERKWLPDVLGCALRVSRMRRECAQATPDDQDLLFATIRRPWTTLLAPWTTHPHDYLANDYFGVSPFQSPDLTQLFYLRLHPSTWQRTHADTRDTRLASALRAGAVVLDLECSTRPYGPWLPLSQLRLDRAAFIDGETLHFQPFRTGRGIRPRGFIHGLRLGVYSLSQRARPRRASGPRLARTEREGDAMDIYTALSNDHRIFERQLGELLAASKAGDDRWKTTLDELRRGLIAHAHAEEAVFYNALREANESKSLVMHSYAEHATAEGEIRTLGAAKAIDANWTSGIEKLSKDLRHHIQEEESRVYDAARKVFSSEEANQLGKAFERMKIEMMKDGDSMIASTVDLIANLLPPRLTKTFRDNLSRLRKSA